MIGDQGIAAAEHRQLLKAMKAGDRKSVITSLRELSVEDLIATGYWPAFGYLAAEAELARIRPRDTGSE